MDTERQSHNLACPSVSHEPSTFRTTRSEGVDITVPSEFDILTDRAAAFDRDNLGLDRLVDPEQIHALFVLEHSLVGHQGRAVPLLAGMEELGGPLMEFGIEFAGLEACALPIPDED